MGHCITCWRQGLGQGQVQGRVQGLGRSQMRILGQALDEQGRGEDRRPEGEPAKGAPRLAGAWLCWPQSPWAPAALIVP